MKILIISLPRTGSTSLLNKLSEENNLQLIFEPWDGSDRYRYNSSMVNCCLKTMIYHIPLGYENVITGYVELVKEFDKVILLSRRDLKECGESWAYLKHHNHKGFDSTRPYVWKNPPDVDKHTEDINKWNNELIEISKILNVDITYYEDIFDKNSNERYRKNIPLEKNKLI